MSGLRKRFIEGDRKMEKPEEIDLPDEETAPEKVEEDEVDDPFAEDDEEEDEEDEDLL